MKNKPYEQQQKEERVDSLLKGGSVIDWLNDCLGLANEKEYKLVIDPISKKSTLFSTNANANVDGADLIGTIVLALKELEDFAQHGCVILYKQNDAPVTLCNTKLQNCFHQFTIEEETLYKHINNHIVVTNQLEEYKSQGYMYFDNYMASENLKATKKSLLASKWNLWFAIAGMAVSIFAAILTICFA